MTTHEYNKYLNFVKNFYSAKNKNISRIIIKYKRQFSRIPYHSHNIKQIQNHNFITKQLHASNSSHINKDTHSNGNKRYTKNFYNNKSRNKTKRHDIKPMSSIKSSIKSSRTRDFHNKTRTHNNVSANYNIIYKDSLNLHATNMTYDISTSYPQQVFPQDRTYKFYTHNKELRSHAPRKGRQEYFKFIYDQVLAPQPNIQNKTKVNHLSAVLFPSALGNNKKGHILLDTGSSISIIDKQLLPENYNFDKTSLPLIQTANKGYLTTHGWTHIKIILQDITLIHKVLISENMVHKIILGTDFLNKHKMILNYENATFSISNNKIKHTFPFHTKWVTHVCSSTTYKNFSKQKIFDKNNVELNIANELTLKQHNEIIKLLNKYKHMFTTQISDLTEANVEPVQIQLINNQPLINYPPYRLPLPEKQFLERHIQDLLNAKILEPSESSVSSPVFLIKNKIDNSFRMVTDQRRINKAILTPSHPLPTIDSILHALSNKPFMCKIDLSKAYLQVPVHENSRPLLAIKTEIGLYQYRRLCFGLSASPAIFQRIINQLLNKFLYTTCVAYLDDIIIYGNSFHDCLSNLREIFKVLDNANFKLNTKKSIFMTSRMEVLGHDISPVGIQPLQKNIQAILEYPEIYSQKTCRQFLGLCGFHRKYIKDYAKIAQPLTNLLKSDYSKKKFVLPDDAKTAFETLKKCLSTPPVLAHFNEHNKIHIYTDGSKHGLGAVLTQVDQDNCERPVFFLSRTLKGSENRYSAAELEALALIYALQHWRLYILGKNNVTVFTDHKNLQSLFNSKRLNARMTKYQLILSDYQVTIKYNPGKSHLAPDALSRNAIGPPLPDNYEDRILFNASLTLSDIKTQQESDKYFSNIIKALKDSDDVPLKFFQEAKAYFLDDQDILHFKAMENGQHTSKLVIPKALHTKILNAYHDKISCGHLGFSKTFSRIKDRFYWPKMYTTVKTYVDSCPSCQTRNVATHKTYGLLKPLSIGHKPFSKIFIDYIENIYPKSEGHCNILVIIDSNTRYAIAYPTTNLTAEITVKYLLKTFFLFGIPQTIISDRGSAFTSNLSKHLEKALGISHNFSSAFHPASHGLVERQNKTIIALLSHYITTENTNWASCLNPILYAYNTSKLTDLPYSPFQLLFGYEPRQPLDLLILDSKMDPPLTTRLKKIQQIRREVPTLLKNIQNKQKQFFDNKHTHVEFKPGDLVLLKQQRKSDTVFYKFKPRYYGPHRIIKQIHHNNYLIEINKDGEKYTDSFHVSKIKKFMPRT